MSDILQKLTAADYVTSAWSGGATIQISIAPEGACYADREFLWRVSSASVELEESDFTALPDYRRLIAPVRGEMTLTHDGGAPIRLRPGQVHAFEGCWATHSAGRCTDFNLMLRRGRADGTMEALTLSGETAYPVLPRAEEVLLYCAEGACTITVGERQILLAEGETLRWAPDTVCMLRLEGTGRLMVCQMWRRSPGSDI